MNKEKKIGMIDITEKKVQHRIATAKGTIILKRETIIAIKNEQVKKGNPIIVGQVAALSAIKQTPILIPMCHQIPITHIDFETNICEDSIDIIVTVKTTAQTGVEMEALVGVTTMLNVIWDMTKYLEKDEMGQYKSTQINNIHVISKEKKDLMS